MTHDTARPAPASAEEIARAVRDVPGVAFLKPGLADRLRATPGRSPRAGAAGDRTPTAGVRLSRAEGTRARAGAWYVDIRLVARREARALDVARAARRSVETYLVNRSPAVPAHVTVPVTGQV